MPWPSRSRCGCRRAPMPRRSCWPASTLRPACLSQGDPRPVLMRITGPAWTAAEDGTALQVDVDGCTVTGAAHGDLSSEKVYVRFRTMTCAGPEPGTVIETDVAGFVAGSGKTGVRGPVVSREGALVEKAFLAGVVSGLGQGVSQAFQPQAVATGTGAAVANTGLGDIGRAGLGAGASSGRPEGRRLHDPPRRAIPAGGPAPGRHEGDAGVLGRCPDRRAPEGAGAAAIHSRRELTWRQGKPVRRAGWRCRPPRSWARWRSPAVRRGTSASPGSARWRRAGRATASPPPIRRCPGCGRAGRCSGSRSGRCANEDRAGPTAARATTCATDCDAGFDPFRLAGAAVRSRHG